MTDTDYNDAEKLKADLYAVLCERNEMATEITELRAEIERLVASLHEASRASVETQDLMQAEIERLRKVLAIEGLSCKVAADIERQQAEIERLRADSQQLNVLTLQWNTVTKAAREEIERLWAALADLVGAVTAEVNEKGGGGYILARLSDARAALEPERLHIIRNHLRTGALGQREVWEEWLTEAADEITRLRAALKPFAGVASEWDSEDLSLEVELRAYDDRPGPGVSVADFRDARAALEHKL